MSKNLHSAFAAIWNVLTVNYSAGELFLVVLWCFVVWVNLRLLPLLLGIPHIPMLLSIAVLYTVWLAIMFTVPIVMRRKGKK